MNPTILLYIQVGVFFILEACLFSWYIWPKIKTLSFYSAAIPMLAVSVLRISALNFINPYIAVNSPAAFAVPAAYGDLISAVIALIALIAVKKRNGAAVALTWAYIIFGALDLGYTFLLGLQYSLADHVGAFGLLISFQLPAVIIALIALIVVTLKNPKDKGVM